jgi:hypothetical protein
MANCCALIIDNREGLEPIISAHEKYIPKDWPVYWLKNEATTTIHEYNKLLTSKRLWRNLPEKVLIFQSDSMLLRDGVEDFLEFDFCGANIKKISGCFNGGLSIRDSKAMLKVINQFPYQGEQISGNEDIWFVNCLRKLGSHLPTYEQSNKFSVETEYHLGAVGYHAIDKYLNPSECEAIRNQYK